MDRESMQKMRLDRRLLRRRGWISQEELERELTSLPDVSHKVAPPEEPDESDEEPAPSEGAPS